MRQPSGPLQIQNSPRFMVNQSMQLHFPHQFQNLVTCQNRHRPTVGDYQKQQDSSAAAKTAFSSSTTGPVISDQERESFLERKGGNSKDTNSSNHSSDLAVTAEEKV